MKYIIVQLGKLSWKTYLIGIYRLYFMRRMRVLPLCFMIMALTSWNLEKMPWSIWRHFLSMVSMVRSFVNQPIVWKKQASSLNYLILHFRRLRCRKWRQSQIFGLMVVRRKVSLSVSLMKPICNKHRLLSLRVKKAKLWPSLISCQPKINRWLPLTLCVMTLKRHLKASWTTSSSNYSNTSKQKTRSTLIWGWLP